MESIKTQVAQIERTVEQVNGRTVRPNSALGRLVVNGRNVGQWEYDLSRLFGWTVTVPTVGTHDGLTAEQFEAEVRTLGAVELVATRYS